MKTTKTALMIGCVLAAAFVLGACREDEQGRRLGYDKGNYSGKPDTALSADARRSIQDRVYYQAGAEGGGGGTPGTSGVSSSSDVRPPSAAVEGAK